MRSVKYCQVLRCKIKQDKILVHTKQKELDKQQKREVYCIDKCEGGREVTIVAYQTKIIG